jgi:hypothetical protein
LLAIAFIESILQSYLNLTLTEIQHYCKLLVARLPLDRTAILWTVLYFSITQQKARILIPWYLQISYAEPVTKGSEVRTKDCNIKSVLKDNGLHSLLNVGNLEFFLNESKTSHPVKKRQCYTMAAKDTQFCLK